MTELQKAAKRVRHIGEGRTINGVYKELPLPWLELFKADLLTLCDHAEQKPSRVQFGM